MLFNIDVLWFFMREKSRRTLKMTRQQLSDIRYGWFGCVFLKKMAFSNDEIGICFNIKKHRQLLFFTMVAGACFHA